MKQQDLKKLRVKSQTELIQELEEKKKELVEARFKLSQEQLENVHLPKKLRKEIAIIKTIIAEQSKTDKQSGKEKSSE